MANTFYVFVLALAGHFYKKKEIKQLSEFKKIAVLVPSYKEDEVIVTTTLNLLSLDYPKSSYDVIIIADSLLPTTVKRLQATDAIVIPVSFEKSMKSRSLNYAFTQIQDTYDIAVIADADNAFSNSFLKDINSLHKDGITIVQAQRVAKNLNSPMAVLDGLSEAINNHLYRQGSNALGLSSALIGSGMSFPYGLLKEELSKIDSTIEDRELQISLAEKGYSVWYQKGTLVFDEKVESAEAYKNQRKRWIAGQFQMVGKYFLKGLRLLLKGNVNFFNIAVLHNIFLSRIISIILLLTLSALFSISFLFSFEIAIRWWVLTGIYFSALAIATPRIFYSKKLILSFTLLPIVIGKTIQALFSTKNATKHFIHTKHKNNEVDTSYFSEK